MSSRRPPLRARRLAAALAFAALAAPAAAQSPSPKAAAILEAATAACRAYENGSFDAGGAVTPITLRSQFGDVAAEIVDEGEFACSSSRSLCCGSGGCTLSLVVENTAYAWQATGWRLVEWGPETVLLLARDGGWCGGAGSEVCHEAVNWSAGRPLTVGEAPLPPRE